MLIFSLRPCSPTSLFIFLISTIAAIPAVAADPPSYTQEVRPILSDNCFECHGPDPNTREAGLRLDHAEPATADLGGYAAFVPGSPEESEALVRMKEADPQYRMPPPHAHKVLTEEQIATVEAWVAAGAVYEMHWAYEPLSRPEIPAENSTGDQDMPSALLQNPVDAFINRKLAEKQMEPVASADRETLVRRLYLDMLGVPPRPEEVDAFLQDDSADAWRKLVERLLQDTRYGERMAVYWLDLVRYADTIGYHSDNPVEVSAYRDYVIDAFNHNKPYDEFTVEQVAGDLLPESTVEQKIASGYNRLLQTTQEGGAQAKEYRAIYAADRVRNLSGVWLGSTMGCAQCHDHKYDPFTAKDFYSMAAFFADIEERAVGQRDPNLMVPTSAEQRAIEALQEKIAGQQIPVLLEQDASLAAAVKEGQRRWEEHLTSGDDRSTGAWIFPEVLAASATEGVTFERQEDQSYLTKGNKPAKSDFNFEIKVAVPVRAIRVEALTDPSLADGRLSHANGNFVLTSVKVFHGDKELKIGRAVADFEQPEFPVAGAIDDDPNSGWAVAGHMETGIPRSAIFILEDAITSEDASETLRLELQHRSQYGQHYIGRVRLAVTERDDADTIDPEVLPKPIADVLQVDASARSDEQRQQIADYYRTIAPELQAARDNLENWQKQLADLQANARTMLVAQSMTEPRVTRILPRGNWMDDSGEIVEPAVPEFLPAKPVDGRRASRLDLAQWLVSEDNPLTARTFVNRVWKLFMGRGLSGNLNDLGGQGEPPTHPELLDWLAIDFRDNGWDVKRLVRQITTSDAYRRSSVPTAQQVQADPQNRWYARQSRWRVEAEFVRDSVLQISDLLVDEKIGGRSVKPYQPAGYWQHLNFPQRSWEADQGESLYRRSLYTFWCRSFLHPSMLAFDASTREECTAERARSNIPQQALVLLNDPIFVEAARVFAERIARQAGSTDAKIAWACRQAWQRSASDQEVAMLAALWTDQKDRFTEADEDARALVEVGEAPLPADMKLSELAAWTQVARAVISAYETTSRH